MGRGNYLIKVRRSRKSYLEIYLMILIIIGTIVYLYQTRGIFSKYALWIALFFILILVKSTELHRIKDWWGITNSSIVQSTGLLSKNLREVDFNSISDLDLNQSLFKRILNYGDVNVRLFLNETSFTVKDINSPEDFIKQLQKIISDRKGGGDNGHRRL
jgi:hypothetical protein